MALDQSALLELLEALKAADAADVVRQAVESVFQALIDAEATARIGAGPHERTPARVTQRNGYRDRLVSTAGGDVELRIPKLCAGLFFPSLLERRRRIDQALFAVVMKDYVHGVPSTRYRSSREGCFHLSKVGSVSSASSRASAPAVSASRASATRSKPHPLPAGSSSTCSPHCRSSNVT
jgi:hypothetical protein